MSHAAPEAATALLRQQARVREPGAPSGSGGCRAAHPGTCPVHTHGLWLAGLYALTVLRLPEPEPPQVGIVPLPTVLLLGGLLAGVLLALLARGLAVIGRRPAPGPGGGAAA